jgi:phage terminase Nu1 subunit (DNA packaging protein)
VTTQPRRRGAGRRSPTPTPADRPLSRKQLAAAVGVPGSTIDAWRRAGAPRLADGRFRLDAVVAWLRRREDDRAAAGAAKRTRAHWTELATRALALGRLHALAARRAEYVPRDRVAADWAVRIRTFAVRARELPRILAARCARAEADVVEREADAIVRELLLGLIAAGSTATTGTTTTNSPDETTGTPPVAQPGTYPLEARTHR